MHQKLLTNCDGLLVGDERESEVGGLFLESSQGSVSVLLFVCILAEFFEGRASGNHLENDTCELVRGGDDSSTGSAS